MGCSTCRKAPRVVRKPSTNNPEPAVTKATVKVANGSGDQRSRITGLTYVPKG